MKVQCTSGKLFSFLSLCIFVIFFLLESDQPVENFVQTLDLNPRARHFLVDDFLSVKMSNLSVSGGFHCSLVLC